MRMLMTVQMDTEAANRAIQDGSLAQLMDSTVERFKPESIYFSTFAGRRTMYVVFDLDEPARMIEIAEPLFMGLKAKIDFAPAMSPDDVRQGVSRLPR
ncbi:hypothetical protein [Asanoa iriomotensis]|uniref:GYD domain-containing protein n=1 Tax=Asanoa iriomotensis TaxID=234613 RepID=A0ABQ4BWW3_9ACTN|nr:hypothetical protein [Asanoa iriomotensis]GIF55023.1 hypothetical protein Air01nite_11180 [Asanoa iriomotensis]